MEKDTQRFSLHSKKKSSMNVLLNVSFCALRKKERANCSLNSNFLQLHVKNGRCQDDAAARVVGVVLQCEWSVYGHGVRGDPVLLVSHRQRVGVDVVDA